MGFVVSYINQPRPRGKMRCDASWHRHMQGRGGMVLDVIGRGTCAVPRRRRGAWGGAASRSREPYLGPGQCFFGGPLESWVSGFPWDPGRTIRKRGGCGDDEWRSVGVWAGRLFCLFASRRRTNVLAVLMTQRSETAALRLAADQSFDSNF